MAALPGARLFDPVPAPTLSVRGVEPLLVGVIGPPGAGKTRSILRMMRGAQRVRSGPIVLIDTEAGRSKKFSPRKGEPADPAKATYDFLRIDLEPPFRSDRCAEAIRQALKMGPAAIGFDNLSDEHQGDGGYLAWHEEEIPKMGGNEYGAWAKPAAARKLLASVISHSTVPMFFTFVAQEKTEQVDDPKRPGKKKIVQLGWMPVAPLLLVKVLDLTCILPYDSKGTPIWKSRDLPGEDFIRKWPEELMGIMKEGQLTEEHGERLARWAMGEDSPTAPVQGGAAAEPVGELPRRKALLDDIGGLLTKHCGSDKAKRGEALQSAFGTADRVTVSKMETSALEVGKATLQRNLEGLAELRSEREPGEDENVL